MRICGRFGCRIASTGLVLHLGLASPIVGGLELGIHGIAVATAEDRANDIAAACVTLQICTYDPEGGAHRTRAIRSRRAGASRSRAPPQRRYRPVRIIHGHLPSGIWLVPYTGDSRYSRRAAL
jgi:hypothetical protein